MQHLTPEEEYVRRTMKERFDRFFDLYCTPLVNNTEVRLFMNDNESNRVLMEEFRRYAEQRASYEGWGYQSDKFQVTYIPAKEMPTRRRTFMANSLHENVAFEEIKPNLYLRAEKRDADDLRDRLLLFVLKSRESS